MTDVDLSGWARAMRHVEYKAWAEEALGDRRQVYARNTTDAPTAPLVFMADGEADTLRASARAGELICPVPGCPSPLMRTRAGSTRRDHFVHQHAPADPQHNVKYARVAARQLIVDWARRQHASLEVSEDVRIDDVTVNVLVTSPSGRRVAICLVYERLGRDEWWLRHNTLLAAGIPTAWVFGLRSMFFQPPHATKLTAPEDAVARDRARGDLILDKAIFREMRAEGCWPLLLSIEGQQLGSLIKPRGNVAGALGLSPPACRDRILHLVAHDLDSCRLTAHGITTPSVGERLLKLGHEPRSPPPRSPAPRAVPAPLSVPAPTAPRFESRQKEFLRRAEGLDTPQRLALIKKMFLE